MQRLSLAVGTLALALTLTACGDSGSDAVATDETPETSAVGYTPTSDVEPHAAVGQDAAAARELLAAAKEGEPVDWAGVGEAFREGGASLKGDGSVRTLAGLAPEHPAFDLTEHAIEGSGPSAGASDGVRGQRVDKGITVLLAAKVSGELDAAAAKIADGDTDPSTGAPHNVDEAWAFFVAEDQGPASTAGKRAADFEREGEVLEPVLAALTKAQSAATSGDVEAFGSAADEVRSAVDYIFYLATYKYLDHAGDEVTQAEGETFYLGISETVAAASTEADEEIAGAFASGDAEAGRAALHRPEVLTALGIEESERVDG